MTLTLKLRITLSMWLLTAVCTFMAGGLGIWLLLNNEEHSLEQQLRATAVTLTSLNIQDYSDLEDFQKIDTLIQESLQLDKLNQFIQIYTRKGKLITSAPPQSKMMMVIPFSPYEKPTFLTVRWEGKKYLMLVTPYQTNKNKYYLHVAMPSPLFRDIARSTWFEGILLFGTLSLFAFLMAQFLAQKLVSPVKEIARYLKNLSPGETKEWQPLMLQNTGDYLSDISQGVNELTLRVKSSLYNISRARRYLAHEMGNPLAILVGEAEHILSNEKATMDDYRQVLKSSLEELDRMNSVVAAVSKIARTEKNVYRPFPCDLSQWLDDNMANWQKNIKRNLIWKKPDNAMIVMLDPDLLYRFIDNMVRNIRKHTSDKTEASIELFRHNKITVIRIQDNGAGIPNDMITALNAGNSQYEKIGIGLGLCLEIASICHFRLEFANRTGGGLDVVLSFDS